MRANQLRIETGLCMVCMSCHHRPSNYLCAKCCKVAELFEFYSYAARKARMYSWNLEDEGAECWAVAGDLLLELGET